MDGAFISNRRKQVKGQHPSYRILRVVVLAAGLLALLGLPVITVVASMYPSYFGGAAYLGLIACTLVILGIIMLFTLRRLLVMFLDRRGRLKDGRLHVRLLGIFSILAVVPTVLVAVIAIYLLNLGIESWFSTKVNRALEGSLQVAEAYMDENERSLVADMQVLVADPVWRERPWLVDRGWLREKMEERRLDEVALVDDEGTILAQVSPMGGMTLSTDMVSILRAPVARVGVVSSRQDGRVVAVAPVRTNLWLVAQRWMNPNVLARVDQTTVAFAEYDVLRTERRHIRWIVTLLLVMLTGAALAGAIWTGIRLANKIVRPVTALVHGTNRVSAGDLDVRLTPADDDELGVLTQAFNRMTQQLQTQRELVERKNRELDDRRKQMEAVLTGVTAAVLSVDDSGTVRNANQTAVDVLGVKVGRKLDKASEPLAEVWKEFVEMPRPLGQRQVKVETAEGDEKTLLVRLVPQYVEGGKVGSVVMTCDDITPLIGAQRVAAWRDVAQRLAHEIKNPLTPIQLSAERLKRRYLKKMPAEDQELFEQLTTTIVQQAEDMRRMTNEFSDFARMPNAVFQQENIVDLVEQAVVLQKTGRKGIAFKTDYEVEGDDALIWCDRGQVNRVLVNILENAVNAVEAKREEAATPKKGHKSDQGMVKVVVKKPQRDKVQVKVLDNGKGLPKDVEVTKLFDPYVTTRKGGTGLGLAIVRKVMDEHEGQVRLLRRPKGGTEVELTFTIKPAAPHEKETVPHDPEPVAG